MKRCSTFLEGSTRLLSETLQPLSVLGELCRRQLDVHFALQKQVLSQIDLSHGSCPQPGQHLIMTDSSVAASSTTQKKSPVSKSQILSISYYDIMVHLRSTSKEPSL
jgi:hypothetical protein